MQAYVARPPVAVVLKEGSIGLAPGVGRIKAAEYAELVSASQALEHAQTRAADLVRKANTVLDDARQSGLRQGREMAREELLTSVAELRSMLGSWVRQTEPRLAEIALRCVREIVYSTDKSDLVQDSVHRALAEMSAAPDIRIQVHEAHVDELRALASELIERHALRGVVRVEAAMALKPGDCVVESPLGVVDLRVASQLRFVQQTLQPQ
jgi:type III secretion protein L